MNRYLAIVSLLLFLAPAPASADPLPDELVDSLGRIVADNFWGRAVLASGETVERPVSQDPLSPIIPRPDSRRVVEHAVPVGVAMWCGVDWKSFYLGFMQNERTKPWSEIQIAYIGVLFGTAQQTFASSLADGSDCTEVQRDDVAALMNDS